MNGHDRRGDEPLDETTLQKELGDRDVEGVERLPREEQEAVVEAAERNPDETTQRESIEQELMELHRSDAGSDVGD